MAVIPDPATRPFLDSARLPPQVEVLAESPSTNAEVAARARDGAADGLVVVAEHQTAGRGRLDRSWVVPPRAALTFSLLLRPDLPPAAWPWIPLWAGYVVHAALLPIVPTVGLKWPNDVLVPGEADDRKLAGILVERVETPRGPAAVVGIGLNVDLTEEELPVPIATSIALATGVAPDRTALLGDLVAGLADHRGLLADRERLRAAYTQACLTIGRDVRVEVPAGDPVTGTASGLDRDGRLVVRTAAGDVPVGAGDVVHVRTVTPGDDL